ncbi:hypothetical protein [Terrimonas pollutisoli]|uniref:hypothetical protein n=1 Tax=Terrimonas pollutisoli TaxID=3034147 RepID=UPI0023EB180C|nr:hypothetical protein [Terrimonas sp. H1YJ31]
MQEKTGQSFFEWESIKINKYFPFAFIYFFINAVALPFGLTYMALLAPFFYIWVLLKRKKEILLPFIVILLPFVIIHITVVGVELKSYTISLLNLLLVYVFCQAVYTFLCVCKDVEKIFRWILVLNFICCLVAIPLYFTPYYHVLWDEQILTEGVGRLRRLKLLTYEPSYYALLFTPFFFFYLLQFFLKQNKLAGSLLLFMLFLPYLLSFSIGVMASVLFALFFTWISYFKRLTSKRRITNAIITGVTVVAGAMLVLILFFRHNQLFTRISNIFSGTDTSGKGRTIDAFILAGKMLNGKNEYWGIGLGQVKIAGNSIISNYYLYNMDFVATIPNAVAETMAIFGWVGVSIRILIEVALFFFTSVWKNYYRLSLFLFMFIYQFTGSFITNIAEYVIWILAFTNVFRQFDVHGNKESEATRTSQQPV